MKPSFDLSSHVFLELRESAAEKREPDYRRVFKNHLEQVQSQRTAFSLRGFAKKLGSTPSLVSDVLGLKKQVSISQLRKWLQALDANTVTSLLLSRLHAVTIEEDAERKQVLDFELRAFAHSAERERQTEQQFRAASEWHHMALLIYACMQAERFTDAQAAHDLGVSTEEVQSALARLKELGLIQGDAPPYRRGESLVFSSEKRSAALVHFHRSSLEIMGRALEQLDLSTRYQGTETLPLNRRDVAEARTLTNEFLDRMVALSSRSVDADVTVHVGGYWFLVDGLSRLGSLADPLRKKEDKRER